MIAVQEKKANIAAGVWIATIVALVSLFATGQVQGNIWETGNTLAITLFSLHGLALAFALWFYAKAKGYWGVLGVSLFLLSFLGLIILMMLPDRRLGAT